MSQLPSLACRLWPRIIRDGRATSSLLHATMDSLRTRFILSIPFVILGFLLTRAPFTMTSVAPSQPWADGPLKLITTPQFQTKKVRRQPAQALPAFCLPDADGTVFAD